MPIFPQEPARIIFIPGMNGLTLGPVALTQDPPEEVEPTAGPNLLIVGGLAGDDDLARSLVPWTGRAYNIVARDAARVECWGPLTSVARRLFWAERAR